MSRTQKLTPELIGRAIDSISLNKALVFIIAVAAAGFFFDSFDIVIVSYALPLIKLEFNLDPKQVGLIGSAALAGMGLGSWMWGWVADRWGRRVVFAATVLMFSVCTGIAGLSMSLGFLIGARFMTGLGLGGMVPIDQALVAEYAPARIRGRVSATLPLCWPIGIFAAAGAGLLIVPHFGWRWLFALGVLPAVLVFFIRRGVPESPRWLADQGRHEEARASLRYVGVDDATIERARSELAALPATKPEPEAKFADLFSARYARRVAHTWLMWFCSGFAATAFSVWLPSIFATYYHINLTRTLVYTFIVAGTSVVGRMFAFSLIDLFGRKALIVIGYGVAGGAALMFTQATTETALLATAMLYGFFADIGSLAMTVYTPEVYPVRIRGKGAAIAMGWGRFGGMVSPIVAGFLISADNLNYVWGLMGAFQFTSAGLTLLLAHETSRRNLESVAKPA
ncbi:MAG: transporter, putative metabolite:H+ symporter [Acetobacteraceae bacterium]|nr:sugar phosphate permease [Rhodopila sp.]MEA2770007.1 transporter, putative metabolite:H+ symporter [Acetobacteraceae bacterium]